MARLTAPDEGSRLVYRIDGAVIPVVGARAVFYSDAAGTTLADIRDSNGNAVASTLTVDAYSRLPLFQMPDGVDTVYVSVAGGPLTPVYARNDDRLDTLTANVATNTAAISAEATARAAADTAAALAASGTYALGTTGLYVPAGWGSFWRPKLAAAKAGTGKATVALVGDSISEGYYASDLDATSWSGRMRTALQTGAAGGSGYRSPARSLVFANAGARGASIPVAARTAYVAAGNYYVVAGTWAETTATGTYAPGAYAIKTVTAGSTVTRTFTGTSLTIYTLSNGGANAGFTYAIDGGATVPVADAAGYAVQKTTITGLSSGPHTVVVTYNGDGVKTLYFLGSSAENSTGVVVNNFSQYGRFMSDYSLASGAVDSGLWSGGASYPADLVVLSFGVNEAQSNVVSDTFLASVRKYLDRVRDGISGVTAAGATDLLFLIQHVGAYDTANYKYQDYVARLAALAHGYGAAVVDIWALGRNSWNYWNGLGYWANGSVPGSSGTDQVHPSDAGHQAIWNVLSPIVTATA